MTASAASAPRVLKTITKILCFDWDSLSSESVSEVESSFEELSDMVCSGEVEYNPEELLVVDESKPKIDNPRTDMDSGSAFLFSMIRDDKLVDEVSGIITAAKLKEAMARIIVGRNGKRIMTMLGEEGGPGLLRETKKTAL